MSWGERSCTRIFCKPEFCTIGACNVDCSVYTWDGKTKADSVATQGVMSKEMHEFIEKETVQGFIASYYENNDLGHRVMMGIKQKYDVLNGR